MARSRLPGEAPASGDVLRPGRRIQGALDAGVVRLGVGRPAIGLACRGLVARDVSPEERRDLHA
jgi:hypothetical protein